MEIQFIASFPDIQTAISIGGDGSTRIKLDMPETEIASAVKLVLLKGMAFTVTIKPLSDNTDGEELEGVNL